MRRQTSRNSKKEMEPWPGPGNGPRRAGGPASRVFQPVITRGSPRPWRSTRSRGDRHALRRRRQGGAGEQHVRRPAEVRRGLIGIKPFASGTILKSGGSPDFATKQEDDDRAAAGHSLRTLLRHDALYDPGIDHGGPGEERGRGGEQRASSTWPNAKAGADGPAMWPTCRIPTSGCGIGSGCR